MLRQHHMTWEHSPPDPPLFGYMLLRGRRAPLWRPVAPARSGNTIGGWPPSVKGAVAQLQASAVLRVGRCL